MYIVYSRALQGLTKNIFSNRQGLPFAYGNIADKAAKPDGRSLLTTCTIPVDCGGQLYVQLNFFVYMASSLTGHWYGPGDGIPVFPCLYCLQNVEVTCLHGLKILTRDKQTIHRYKDIH